MTPRNFQAPQTNLVPFAWIFFLDRRLVEMFGNGSAVSVWSPGSVVSGAALSELQARLEGWDRWIWGPGDGLMIAGNIQHIQHIQRLKTPRKVSGRLGNAPKNAGLVDF